MQSFLSSERAQATVFKIRKLLPFFSLNKIFYLVQSDIFLSLSLGIHICRKNSRFCTYITSYMKFRMAIKVLLMVNYSKNVYIYVTLYDFSVLKVKLKIQNGECLPEPKLCPCGLYEVMVMCFCSDAHQRPSFHNIKEELIQVRDYIIWLTKTRLSCLYLFSTTTYGVATVFSRATTTRFIFFLFLYVHYMTTSYESILMSYF